MQTGYHLVGMERTAKKYNVKQFAESILFLQQHAIHDKKTLDALVDGSSAKYHELMKTIKDAEEKMATNKVIKTHIINYAKTRETYITYRKSGYSKKFFEAHRDEITLHKAAKEAFPKLPDGKIPKVKDLNEEFVRLLSEKKAAYSEYKKIKKEKPLAPITEDEIPFDIPNNWCWVRLGEVGVWGSGATPLKSNAKYYGGDIRWLLTGDLNDGLINEVRGRITELALKETSVKLNPPGSVLIAMYGATIGKLGILNVESTTNQACCACQVFNGMFNKYLFHTLLAYRNKFIAKGEGGAQPNISKEKIVNTVIPLPPLSEQERIVAKLEKLLPLCDGLAEE